MKKIRIILLILILYILLIYTVNISAMPSNIVLIQGEELNLRLAPGVEIKYNNEKNNKIEAIEASSNISNKNNIENISASANLFGISVKNIDINIIENSEVVPLGNIVGLKLYTNGVLVVGMSEITGKDTNLYKPYEEAGIVEGDMIVELNDDLVSCTSDLIEEVNNSSGKEIKVKYLRDGKILETSIKPAMSKDNSYKLGLWVRDSAAGLGTLTFYEPNQEKFAALGHGIMDIDTGKMLNISNGEFIESNIISIIKGQKGEPGKIQGAIQEEKIIGKIENNTAFGVFGTLNNIGLLNTDLNNKIPVALRNEIKEGNAVIMCTLENGIKKEYEVEIKKVFRNNYSDNKSMIIEVKDKELLEKTGGIIQGMSGSPIIQDGKLVGALTHVLVSDPTQGYGVFGDMMLKQLKSYRK